MKYLYDDSWSTVKSYVLNHGGNKAQAEDLFQDAVVKVFLKVKQGGLNDNDNLGAYLFTITKNAWITKVKKDKKIELVDDLVKFRGNQKEEKEEDFDMVRSRALDHALAALGDTCKDLLKLTFYMGKSLAEASEIMNLKNSEVAKTYQYRCKKRLKLVLQDNPSLKEIMAI